MDRLIIPCVLDITKRTLSYRIALSALIISLLSACGGGESNVSVGSSSDDDTQTTDTETSDTTYTETQHTDGNE